MKTLTPVDFKAVAAKGCFVYCYLRADGSPYYIGIASNASRPFAKHECGVPRRTPERVRLMRSGLTWAQAVEWEKRYIRRYGRKDIGTGILRNLTDGGEGALGLVIAPEVVARRAEKIRGSKRSAASRALMSSRAKGRRLSPTHRARIAEAGKGKKASPKAIALLVERNALPRSPESLLKRSRTRMIKAALKHGVCPLLYGLLPTYSARAHFVRKQKGESLGSRQTAQTAAVTARLRNNAALVGLSEEEYKLLSPSRRRRLLKEAKAA